MAESRMSGVQWGVGPYAGLNGKSIPIESIFGRTGLGEEKTGEKSKETPVQRKAGEWAWTVKKVKMKRKEFTGSSAAGTSWGSPI